MNDISEAIGRTLTRVTYLVSETIDYDWQPIPGIHSADLAAELRFNDLTLTLLPGHSGVSTYLRVLPESAISQLARARRIDATSSALLAPVIGSVCTGARSTTRRDIENALVLEFGAHSLVVAAAELIPWLVGQTPSPPLVFGDDVIVWLEEANAE